LSCLPRRFPPPTRRALPAPSTKRSLVRAAQLHPPVRKRSARGACPSCRRNQTQVRCRSRPRLKHHRSYDTPTHPHQPGVPWRSTPRSPRSAARAAGLGSLPGDSLEESSRRTRRPHANPNLESPTPAIDLAVSDERGAPPPPVRKWMNRRGPRATHASDGALTLYRRPVPGNSEVASP
jgi:hypothetical protein